MPQNSPVPHRNGFTDVFLTGFKTAVPGSASQGRGSSKRGSLLARCRRAQAGWAGRQGSLGRLRLRAPGCPRETRHCPAPLGSARPRAWEHSGTGTRGPGSGNQGRKHQAWDACGCGRKGLHISHHSQHASPSNKAVPASLCSRGWERAPSCSGNATDHFPFPLSAPA